MFARRKMLLGRFAMPILAAMLALGAALPAAFAADETPSGPSKSGSVGGANAQVDATAEITGGPIVIMGIDAEDGGVGDHGPISVYVSVMNSILANATNGGSGILVIGGGKSPTDDVTTWWDALGAGTGQTITYVNGAANITAQSFAGFKVIGVASGDGETSDGGLTAAESDALAGRQADIASFVNTGGGLLVFAQDFDEATTSQYAFLGGIGTFSFVTDLGYDDIAPTADGTAIGITDDLDVSAWHDVYLTFPSFLNVLAVADDSSDEESFGKVAALGGANVIIGDQPAPPVNLQPNFTG
jgi:hypothetical protein